MAKIQKRTRIRSPIGTSSNSEVVEARSSATYGDFASLDARLENFELTFAGSAPHGPVTLAADIATIMSITAQELSLDSQSANLAFLSPNGSAGDPTFRSIAVADLPSTIVYNTRTITAGNGLTGGGALSANVTITMGTPGTATSTSTNAVTATSHTHAIDSTIARITDIHAQQHVLATTSALGADHTVSGLTARQVLIATGPTTALFRTLQTADLPTGATLSVSSTNSGNSHAITTSSNPGAVESIVATDTVGYVQLVRLGAGIVPSYPLHASSAVNFEALYVEANSITTGVAFTMEAPLSTGVGNGKTFQIKVSGESFGRLIMYSDGKLGVGPGSATRDTYLSRASANRWLVSSDGDTGVAHIDLNAGGEVDGVDISAHAANANAHHNQSHALVGGDHTASGLTTGHVLTATSATTFAFQASTGVSPHVLATTSALGTEHTVSGLTARQVLIATGATTALFRALVDADIPSNLVRDTITITAGNGLTGGGTLAANRTITMGTPGSSTVSSTNAVTTTSHTHAVTSSSNPGAAASILQTSAGGALTLTGDFTIATSGNLNNRFLMTNSSVSGSSVFYDFNQTDRDGGSTGSFELGFFRNATNTTQLRMSKEILEVIIEVGGTFRFPLEVRGTQVILAEMPTSDPGIIGALYRNSFGNVSISI